MQLNSALRKFGHLQLGDVAKMYGAAGAWMYCAWPVRGWIRTLDADCSEQRVVEMKANSNGTMSSDSLTGLSVHVYMFILSPSFDTLQGGIRQSCFVFFQLCSEGDERSWQSD